MMQSVRQARRQLMEEELRIDWIGGCMRAPCRLLLPVAHALFDLLAPWAVPLRLEEREQGAQRLGAVTDKADLHRIAQAEHTRVDVDLDAACLPRLGKKLGIREA